MKRNLNNLIVIEKKMIMKQLKLKSFMLGMMLLVTASASAYDFTVDGKYYNILDLQGSTCEITHGDEKYTGDIVIPEYEYIEDSDEGMDDSTDTEEMDAQED